MNEVPKKPRALKNVTITLDSHLYRLVRIKAAEADTSMSKLVEATLREVLLNDEVYQRAMQSYLSRTREPKVISSGEPYPSRDEAHERSGNPRSD